MTEAPNPGDKEINIEYALRGLEEALAGASEFPGTSVEHIFNRRQYQTNDTATDFFSREIVDIIAPHPSDSREDKHTTRIENTLLRTALGPHFKYFHRAPSEFLLDLDPEEELPEASYVKDGPITTFGLPLSTSLGLDYNLQLSFAEQFPARSLVTISHGLTTRKPGFHPTPDFDPIFAEQGLEKAVKGAMKYPGTHIEHELIQHNFGFDTLVDGTLRKVIRSTRPDGLDSIRHKEEALLQSLVGNDFLAQSTMGVSLSGGFLQRKTAIPNLNYYINIIPMTHTSDIVNIDYPAMYALRHTLTTAPPSHFVSSNAR